MAQAAALVDGEAMSGGLTTPGNKNRSSQHARAAFHAADVKALWIGLWMRVAALGVILLWLATLVGPYATTFYLPFFIGYIAIGFGQYLAGKHRQDWRFTP